MEASWGVLRRLGSIPGCLGRFRAVLRAFSGCLEASWSLLGVVLEPSWGRLGASWVSLGRHVGVLGASWRYLVPDFQSKRGLI